MHPPRTARPFSALAQIKETFALLDASFRHANIALAIEPGPDVRLVGFPNEYSQVLLNLLSNAKEAITERQISLGKVTVRLGVRDGVGCLTVRDNGGGIPEDLLESLGASIVARNVEGGAELDVLTPLARDPAEPPPRPPDGVQPIRRVEP
jgi:signal transduction histidine kinase